MIEYIKRKKKGIIKATIVILFLIASSAGIVEYVFRYSVSAIIDLIVSIEMVLDIKADKEHLLGYDFRLFQDTEAWDLAKAVKWQNTSEIRRQISEQKVPVDFREKQYGQTLLMLAIRSKKYHSIPVLLELGANPNIPYDSIKPGSQNAVMLACDNDTHPMVLKLLLKYGGDPNSVIRSIEGNDSAYIISFRESALCLASHWSLEKVKILVEAGADVNQSTPDTYPGAIKSALDCENMDIALYLLKHGADYTRKYPHIERIDGEKIYYVEKDILFKLRQCILPLNSEQYKYKLKIIDFLQKRGLNYWDSEIPDYILEKIKTIYPKDWEEYIKKY